MSLFLPASCCVSTELRAAEDCFMEENRYQTQVAESITPLVAFN
jgi:hypothetical protein